MGMVGIANREGGYSPKQKDLESIVPAIAQAPRRQRSEENFRGVYENLQVQSKKLQARSEKFHKINEMLLKSERHFIKWLIRSHNWLGSPIQMDYIY